MRSHIMRHARVSSLASARVMSAASLLLIVASSVSAQRQQTPPTPYVPGAAWEKRTPEQVGMDAGKIQEAVAFAKERETRASRDLEENHYQTFGRQEPFANLIGPVKPRGDMTGVIVKNGYIIAEWGEPARVDMTHSVTKSFVSTMVGLAVERGLIRNIDDTVYKAMGPILHARTPRLAAEGGTGRFDGRVPIEPFNTPHNRKITWRHLLTQSSDFEGVLWGKPEWADRPSNEPATWQTRARVEPGTVHEYNDTRVNALALAATSVWRRPLPEVLRELVMDPIGASQTWRWYGYDDSWIVLDGQMIQSVSGGGHWGGGMFISAYDQARFGLLTMRNGKWGAKQIIPESWIKESRTPSAAQPTYGFMNFYLNTGKRSMPNAPETTFWHLGNGTNAVICDPEHDLVVVLRWIGGGNQSLDGVMQRVIASLQQTRP
jgi:CubicO group peptidase (beta-lactamase class C family)